MQQNKKGSQTFKRHCMQYTIPTGLLFLVLLLVQWTNENRFTYTKGGLHLLGLFTGFSVVVGNKRQHHWRCILTEATGL